MALLDNAIPQQNPQQQGLLSQGMPNPMPASAEEQQASADPMRDAVPLVLQLKNMSQEEREQNWPQLLADFESDHPQVKGMFDPNSAPTDEQLQQILPLKDNSPIQRQQAPQQNANGLTPENQAFLKSSVAGEAAGTGVSPFDIAPPPARKKAIEFKTPSGYRLVDSENPSLGLEPIPGGPADIKTPEQAAKVQMLRTAQDGFNQVKDLLYNKDGTINRQIVNTSNIPVVGGSVPWTDGRRFRTGLEYGIQAITRAETGAAMPQSEVDNTRARFMPSALDDDRTIHMKMEMFNKFINGELQLIDSSGRFNHQRFTSDISTLVKESWIKDAAKANPTHTKEELEQAWDLKQAGKLNAK